MVLTVTGLDFSIELAIWIPVAMIVVVILYNIFSSRRDK